LLLRQVTVVNRQNVLYSLNLGLHQAFISDSRVHLLGEDILDPYGGAFKVTRGLSTAFPERVWTTPISEAGIVGIATGMAMRGLLPVVEIMFGDFLTLAADQIINHLSKFAWMYSGGKSSAEQVTVPIVIRTPMGGRRGYGPTHSQTLEKLFMGVPGLKVVAPTHFGNPGNLLARAILQDQNPVLFIENKLQYLLPLENSETNLDFEQFVDNETCGYPTYILRLRSAPLPQITIAAYSYMAELARRTILQLAYGNEIFCELVIPTMIAPFDITILADSIQRTRRLLILEEGTLTLGWGAEIVSRLVEKPGLQPLAVKRLAALEYPVPASGPLEATVLPGEEQILQACKEILQQR
jgi:2-oxoisovalerate dehydrogenase E1 component